MLASGLLRLLCIHFVSLLTTFDQNLSSGWPENARKAFKTSELFWTPVKINWRENIQV